MREESPVWEMTEISRLSANQAESRTASPFAMYLAMGMNTSYPSSWAEEAGAASSATAQTRMPIHFFITALFLQIPSHLRIFVTLICCGMDIKLLTVGKTDVKWVKEGLDLYMARLSHYVPFTLKEIPQLKNVSALTREQIREREGELILKAVRPADEVILLDERGREFRSLDFARYLEEKLQRGRDVVFVIGGAYGFSEAVYARSDGKVSLSKMTFSHQMVRTLFAEQLYRAFTIIKGEPYHHE